jgi:hypothetical protein
MMTFLQILGATMMMVSHGYIGVLPSGDSRGGAEYVMLAGAAILVGVSFFKYVL